MEQVLLTESKNGVLYITLNRPEKMNALSNALMEALHKALTDFRLDDSQRVAVIRGAGKNFCSGADIRQFGDKEAQTEEAIERRAAVSMEVHGMISQIPKPVISSVRGYALAGGCGVALAADLVVASENALFGYPEIRRGFVPALVLVNLSKLVGRRRALEMILTGKRFGARQCLEWGLINQVVPDEQLETATTELAEMLAGLSASALARTKSLFYKASEQGLLDGLLTAKEVNEAMRKTKDFAAGVSEFKGERQNETA